jgi:hypothetical protein
MAVMMIMDSPESTTEQYDRTNELLGIHGDDEAPEGLIQHVAASDGSGLVIVDVWDSAEAFARFMERVGPAAEEAGLGGPAGDPPPPMQVHNRVTGQGKAANLLMLFDVDGLTTDQYDQMASRMPSHEGGGSDGPWVVHTAAVRDGGVVVADLWESAEAFGQFAQEQIAPAGEEVGMGPAEPRIIPVHNVINGRARVA